MAPVVGSGTAHGRRDGDSQAHAAARSPRRRRREAGALRGLGDAGAVRRHPRGAHGGARALRHLRRQPHGRGRDLRPGAEALLQRLLSNDVSKIAERGAQYSVLCNERGGVLDDLFTYRLGPGPLPDRHQREQPRARPRVVRAPRARARRGRRATGWPTSRCSRSRARGRARSWPASPTASCPRASGPRELTVAGAPGRARLRHRLHGRGRRRAAGRARRTPAPSGTRSSPPAPPRSGSARATRCAWRPASTSTATTSPTTAGRSRPGSAGAARRTPASSAPRPCARRARTARPRSSSRSRSPAPASPARATR